MNVTESKDENLQEESASYENMINAVIAKHTSGCTDDTDGIVKSLSNDETDWNCEYDEYDDTDKPSNKKDACDYEDPIIIPATQATVVENEEKETKNVSPNEPCNLRKSRNNSRTSRDNSHDSGIGLSNCALYTADETPDDSSSSPQAAETALPLDDKSSPPLEGSSSDEMAEKTLCAICSNSASPAQKMLQKVCVEIFFSTHIYVPTFWHGVSHVVC